MKTYSYFLNIDLSQYESLASRGISSTNEETYKIFEKMKKTIAKKAAEQDERRRKRDEK